MGERERDRGGGQKHDDRGRGDDQRQLLPGKRSMTEELGEPDTGPPPFSAGKRFPDGLISANACSSGDPAFPCWITSPSPARNPFCYRSFIVMNYPATGVLQQFSAPCTRLEETRDVASGRVIMYASRRL